VRFRDDERAVTVQIGAILLFATIIIALSLYQATVVPAQNADVEYKHSQTVQNQLSDVRNAILRTAGSGNSQPVTVSLGTQYPSRVFLMNPPPATGTLRTGAYENGTVQLSNVNATNDETRDFLAGSWNASTKYLAFEPDYSEYDNPPDLLYESSVLSNYYPNADNGTAIPLTDQLLVNNETKTITLVTLNGSVSTTRASAVSVTPVALSAPYQRVQVEKNNTTDPAVLSVPTKISAAQLRNQTDLGSHPGFVDVTDHPTESDRVVIEVDWDGQFTLQTSRIGLGSGSENPDPHYLTLIENRGDRVIVEARDRFNNAESGVTVSVDNASLFKQAQQITDENGRATFVVANNESGDATLDILGGDTDHEIVEVFVDANRGGNGQDNGDSTQFSSKVVDQGQTGSLARYEVSYDATDVADFDHMEVTFGNVNNNWANETYTSTDPRNNIDDYGWTDESGGTGGDTYEITIEIFDSGGNSIESRTVTDTADGANPSGNDDLTESDSPTLDSTTLRDTNPNNVEYELDYEVDDTAGKYLETEVLFMNTDSPYATDEVTGTTLAETVQYSGYSIGDQFEIYVQVQDDDGIVVDQTVLTDEADGSYSGGTGGETYDVTINSASDGGGNSIDVEFSVDTTNNNAQVEVQSLSNDGSVRDSTGLVTVSSSQPQTETVNGKNQAAEVRVILYDENGNQQDSVTVGYPYP